MKIGIIISSNDAETCWNALRYANYSIGQQDEVKVFFMGKGVEYQSVSTDKFNTIEQSDKFLKSGGKVYACGTCIKSRQQKESEACPISTLKDMYEIVKESDKVITF
ncbi:sulfur reduction protein DsrE [candidate division WOR-1 bacterium RIFOXYD2_FULL_36_8]|uniref:Sulfur reduction protein DsrE n=1 Tax=candidate division WOR-1 bacterium RIFOXYB2_FULL_36_35 TaxID=1802578 RepID=A0A1F4S4S8_UNCSA|nr:MAG: sulfur reduction protein DsrE [candidate division WOR-1 bacterium RIFOXYA2_FULL_36_21]OGC14743.1 MAG: sulfur reduction protein DsrE [candidate division WOR-1 bacterium RIFOXYB2_FULL_36_35]OGC15473.1 MAG: sulfur reduction protein DsrE [candidate division WOR-1 bacterium RIFOXYA12_FULL_36_13]OGC38036.1 MAG: sulfur reduction protein DsrE [candidate division WOR-1 bacterium RIFOXYD2_FULL_36_8]